MKASRRRVVEVDSRVQMRLEYRRRNRKPRRGPSRQPPPALAAVRAGVYLAVACPDVDAFRIEPVSVEPFSVHALVVVRAGQAFRERLPALTAVRRAIDGELTERHAEVV